MQYKDKSKILSVILFLILCIISGGLSERSYHYVYNKTFSKTFGYTNTHILGNILYVSDRGNIRNIENKEDKKIAHEIFDKLEEGKLISKFRVSSEYQENAFYTRNFPHIIFDVIIPVCASHVNQNTSEDKLVTYVENFSRRIYPILAENNYGKYINLSLLKFVDSFTFREGFFLACIFFSFICVKNKLINFILLFTALMLIFNRLIIAPILFMGDRYLFYTDILEQVLPMILFGYYLTEVKNNNATDELPQQQAAGTTMRD